ncbi:MAG: glycosyltransferase [Acidimicrobiales bacterium]|nr:glycosyltransferase [Acidimicrobiales bacterium]
MSEPRDVVFTFSTETLADAAARGLVRPPERMLQTLVRSDRVDRVLVVDAPRWVPAKWRRGRTSWPPALGSPRPHLRPHRWTRREAVEVDAIRAELLRRDAAIRAAADRAGMTSPAVVTFDPLLAGLAPLEWAGPVTYYGRDDWSRFPPRRPWWPAYEAAYAGLRATARGVLAVSAPLLERIGPTGPAEVIPNGIDPGEWTDPGPLPESLAALPRPLFTYVGTVDDRIDEDLLTDLVDGEGTILLVGPCRDDERRARLTDLGAVLHVAADRAELAAIVRHSDVGLIPHARTELTEAMSPLKLYEYRAAGIPVATVDLPPIAAEAAGDAAIVVAPSGPNGFAQAARAAAERGPDDEATRRAYVDDASWAGRHATALDIALRA